MITCNYVKATINFWIIGNTQENHKLLRTDLTKDFSYQLTNSRQAGALFLATFPVTTCTAERSFLALKYIKNYLRTTMTEDRLTGLALLYAHRDVPIDVDDIIKRFADDNRRLNFM